MQIIKISEFIIIKFDEDIPPEDWFKWLKIYLLYNELIYLKNYFTLIFIILIKSNIKFFSGESKIKFK